MAYENKTGLPSVTDILSPFIDKDWFTEESRLRGTAIHAAATCHLTGVWSLPLDPDYQGYFDSFKRWADLMIDKIILVEERLIDPVFKYCGKPDLVAVLKGDAWNTLVDWKTSIAASKTWSLQVAAYRNLSVTDRGIDTSRGMCVRLKKDGKMPKPDEYAAKYIAYENDLNKFKAALSLHKHFN